MKTRLTLDSIEIKRPSEFKIERYNITKAERLANGMMAMDLVAKKRKFFCTWGAISAVELNKLLDIIWDTDSVFFTLTYVESNTVKTATVYTGAIPTTLHRTDNVNWIWKDVNINFIEQ